MSGSRRATMNDVARTAGVSQTTVSFVINGAAGANIPEATRARVWEAVKELDYRPNAMAKALRKQESHSIGFVTDVVATTPHAGKIVEGAQLAAWEAGKLLLLVNTGGNAEYEQAALASMLERRVDAVIYATMYHRLVAPPPLLRELPCVLLDCFDAERSLPSVCPDDIGGGYAATRELLNRGHRRIGFINNASPIPATAARLQGYCLALSEAGVPFDPALVTTGSVRSTERNHAATVALMQLPDPPTALFVFCDQMVIGVYNALADLGLKVPRDVAVVGFDNLEIIAALLQPQLSTMALPHFEMGAWAVNFVLGRYPELIGAPPIQHLLPCPFVARNST